MIDFYDQGGSQSGYAGVLDSDIGDLHLSGESQARTRLSPSPQGPQRSSPSRPVDAGTDGDTGVIGPVRIHAR